MKYDVQIRGLFANIVVRDLELVFIIERVGVKSLWKPLVAQATDDLLGIGLGAEVRFDLAADQVDLYDAVVARLTNYNAGSRVSRHDCNHDEATPVPCVLTEETVA